MLKRIKSLLVSAGMFSLIAAPLSLPVVASADNLIANQVCSGVNAATTSDNTLDLQGAGDTSGCSTADASGDSLQKILTLIINVFSILVGFVAVVMIIYGGVKYITSGGDTGKIGGAKNTIIYALVGLVIVALAQVIVHFVLAKASGVTTTSTT